MRVSSFVELFSAAKCLASRYRPVGKRLAIVTNGGGPGVLAADWVQECGLQLGQYSPLLAAELLPRLLPEAAMLPFACGAAAVLGHCFSPWHGFNGGKGVATLAGVFLALLPQVFVWMFVAFVLTILLTGVVSLAMLFGALVALLAVTCFSPVGVFSPAGAFVLAMVLLVLVTHRDNWRRLWAGRESRFERARVLGRALGLPTIGTDPSPKP